MDFNGQNRTFIKDKFVTTTYANQVSDLTIGIVIFDVDTCSIVLDVSYILILWIVYGSICLWYDMYML